MQVDSSHNPENSVHIQLDFVDAIMSVADSEQFCHPKASYWMPTLNFSRLDVYMKLNKISQIQCMRHFTKIVAGGIVRQLQKCELQ